MKVLIIGSAGTIGTRVAERLEEKYEVVTANRSSGHYRVDLTETASIVDLYQHVGEVDAIVSIAGEAKWAPFTQLTTEDFAIGLDSKLMGQVNLVRFGLERLTPGGSFTLTTGILADDPVVGTTSPAMVNGALHSFVRAAALELTQDRRINAVSCGLVADSAEKYADYFPGHNPIPMTKVVNAYLRALVGKMNGHVITAYDNS